MLVSKTRGKTQESHGGRGKGVLSAATASRMTVGGLSVPLNDQWVALVTEDAGSCDMVTCYLSRQQAVTS